MQRKAKILMIVILDYLKIDIKISGDNIKIMRFGECKNLLEINRFTNKMLAIIQSKTRFFYKNK